jgi:hypothetical protein
MDLRTKQKLGGVVMVLIGGGFTAWTWRTALVEGCFSAKGSLLGPALLVLGLGMTLFPGYREERMARGEDISGLSGWRLITPRWWATIVIGLLAGGVNYFLLASGW